MTATNLGLHARPSAWAEPQGVILSKEFALRIPLNHLLASQVNEASLGMGMEFKYVTIISQDNPQPRQSATY